MCLAIYSLWFSKYPNLDIFSSLQTHSNQFSPANPQCDRICLGNPIHSRLMYFIFYVVNFIVSGNAVEWYFNFNSNDAVSCMRPVKRFFCKNWGSVAGGSFINAFLNIIVLIFDLFRVHHHIFSAVQKESAGKLQLAAVVSVAVAAA